MAISQHGTSVLFTSHPQDGLVVNFYIPHNRRMPLQAEEALGPISIPRGSREVDQWRNHCQNNLYKPNNCRNWTLKLVLRRFALYTFHCTNYFRRIRVIGALHHFQQYFSYVVVAMQFYIVGENWSSWRKSPTFYYSLTDSLTYCEVVCIEYTSLWEGVQITNHSADGWHWLYHQWW